MGKRKGKMKSGEKRCSLYQRVDISNIQKKEEKRKTQLEEKH